MTAAGVPDAFQFWTVSQFAFVFAVLIFMISFFLGPWAELEVAHFARAGQGQGGYQWHFCRPVQGVQRWRTGGLCRGSCPATGPVC